MILASVPDNQQSPSIIPPARPAPLRIGAVQLAGWVLLAPIAGYCDLSFRLVARSCGGVSLACTDLLCPEGVLRENKRSMELAATCPEDSPLAMQLYGAEPEKLCDAARWAVDHGAAIIDINMGCPVDKITKRNGGSALLCRVSTTLAMVEKIVQTVKSVPVTAKLRLGWDDRRIVAPFLANRLEQLGIAAITIHGRTTEMRFTGSVRLDGIASVVAAVQKIPVIGNGDITSPAAAAEMMRVTGCRGVMVGRAALSAPWLLRDIDHYLRTGELLPAPSIAQKCRWMCDHFYNLLRFRNERVAVCEFRKRISWYSKHMHPCRELKDAIRTINSRQDFDQAVATFLSRQTPVSGDMPFDDESIETPLRDAAKTPVLNAAAV
ncbi:MAG: tRNA dihydrouridine synthase DusB [Phycisphaerae bacterium]